MDTQTLKTIEIDAQEKEAVNCWVDEECIKLSSREQRQHKKVV